MPDYQPRFSRKPFQKGGNDRFSKGPKTMYKAQCAKCGDTCEVPFRPNGKKPVYCQNCFVKDEAPRPAYDRGPKREYGAKRDFGPKRDFAPRPSYSAPREDRSMDDMKQELKSMNAKLEQLITLMQKPAPVVKKVPAKKAAKVVKKAVKKKK